MKINRVARAIALVAASAVALSGLTLAPASAAVRDVVRFAESNSPSSLNSSHKDHNLVSNATIAYLTGSGFNYYNDKGQIIKRPGFGKYEVLSKSPLKVKYTVNPGLVWSDGAPIDAYDLLISWVTNSGLFDNVAANVNWATAGKGGGTDKITKFPVIADGGRSMTVTYDEFVSSWEVQIGLGRPVHALTQLAFPNDTNQAAKVRFFKAVRAKDWKTLKPIADQWNTAYNILRSPGVSSSTNPKLLVASGGYKVQSSIPNKSVTLVRNELYKAGPKPTIKTFQILVIDDATAAAQALINGEVDVINPSATAALVELLKRASSRVKLISSPQSSYELIYAKYDGPAWVGMSASEANDLRRAFLLTVPRQEMVTKLIDPVSPGAKTLDSITPYFGNSPFYKRMVDEGGVKPYLASETVRFAEARRLLAKHGYSTAKPFKLKVMWGNPSNERRSGEMALIRAAAAKVGIDAESVANPNWSIDLNKPIADFQFHAYAQTSAFFTGLGILWGYDDDTKVFGAGNRGKWKNATVTKALAEHFKDLTPEQVYKVNLTFEKEWYKDAVGLPLFQFPGVTAHVKTLKGISPAPFSPNVVWNFWTWKY